MTAIDMMSIYVNVLPQQNNSQGQPKTHTVTPATQKNRSFPETLKYDISNDAS